MANLKISGKHILLLLFYVPGKAAQVNEPIEGRTRIIKMMFLFDKEIKREFLKDTDIELISFPEFIPWKYGPFSKDIYNDIEFFINNGFIGSSILENEKTEIEFKEYLNWIEDYLIAGKEDYSIADDKEIAPTSYSVECFQLTGKGIRFVEEKLYSHLSDNQKNVLARFKKSTNSASLEAILRYTYLKYPKYTEKSIIKEDLLG